MTGFLKGIRIGDLLDVNMRLTSANVLLLQVVESGISTVIAGLIAANLPFGFEVSLAAFLILSVALLVLLSLAVGAASLWWLERNYGFGMAAVTALWMRSNPFGRFPDLNELSRQAAEQRG